MGAINFSLLLQRSTQFSVFENVLATVGLTDPVDRALGIGLLHEQWVTAEPAGYARHVTGLVDPPLPGSIPKQILMTVAWLDKQVSNQASEVAARTLGIPSFDGASLLRALREIPDEPEGTGGLGSAYVVYDTGSFDVFDPAYDAVIPPLANLIPSDVCDPARAPPLDSGQRFPAGRVPAAGRPDPQLLRRRLRRVDRTPSGREACPKRRSAIRCRRLERRAVPLSPRAGIRYKLARPRGWLGGAHPRGFPLLVEVLRHDLVIVGGGGAACAPRSPRSRRIPSSRSRSSPRSIRCAATPSRPRAARRRSRAPDDTLEMHGYDTVKGSDFLGDQDVIQYFVEEAPKELTRLEHWGCPWSRNEDGTVATRAFGGMTTKRTWYATDKVGFHMLHALFQHSLRFDRIVRYDEQFVTQAPGRRRRGARRRRARHARGRGARDPRPRGDPLHRRRRARSSRSPPTATSRPATAWRSPTAPASRSRTWSSCSTTRRGCRAPGILITEATRGEGGHLVNKDGERFLVTRDYGVGAKAELGPRDMISRAIMQEIEAGRGFTGPYGDYVHLDLRHLGDEVIEKRLPMVRELVDDLRRRRSDPRRRSRCGRSSTT